MTSSELTSALQQLCGEAVEIKSVTHAQSGKWIILFVPPTWTPRPMPEKGDGASSTPTTMVTADTPFEALAQLVDHVKNPRPQPSANNG